MAVEWPIRSPGVTSAPESVAVLKGISPVPGAEALGVWATMGHGGDLALVGRNFPAAEVASRTVSGRLVRLDGEDATTAAG